MKDENIDCDFQRVDGYLFLAEDDKFETLEKEFKSAGEVNRYFINNFFNIINRQVFLFHGLIGFQYLDLTVAKVLNSQDKLNFIQ